MPFLSSPAIASPSRRLLVTGGAGFIGASLAIGLADRHSDWDLLALDSLRRRGSELNLPRLREAGVDFVTATCASPRTSRRSARSTRSSSARPSPRSWAASTATRLPRPHQPHRRLQLPRAGAPRLGALRLPLDQPRLSGRRARAAGLSEAETRFEFAGEQPFRGASSGGISEQFPLEGARTLYGATKLAAELLIEEYAAGSACTR